MLPDRFEALIGELLIALGFEEERLRVTSYSNDGGIDVRGVLNAGNITEVNAAVQVKRWKNNIQAPVVQSIRGSLVVHEQGIVITTSKFSKGAIAEAQAPGKVRISLVDGEQLLDLLIAHKIGVKAEAFTVYSIDQDWWGGIANPSESNSEEQVAVIKERKLGPAGLNVGLSLPELLSRRKCVALRSMQTLSIPPDTFAITMWSTTHRQQRARQLRDGKHAMVGYCGDINIRELRSGG